VGRTAALRAIALALCAAPAAVAAAGAQGYRLRVDTRLQLVAYRGLTVDSIPVTDTVSVPGEGPQSPDGFAVSCSPADPYCWFLRPGSTRRAAPATSTVDLTVWGLGVTGLSAHASGRLGVDLARPDAWPGLDPAVQLLEGYAEYARARWVGRLGRQIVASRLGTTGLDGATIVARDARRRFDAQAILGWGLARGSVLPATSPGLDPLDDFQPRHRTIVAGVGGGWRGRGVDARFDYLREVDPGTDHFVSERVGVQANAAPLARVQLSAGADYDIAAGWWGSADAALAYHDARLRATVGVRRYRPHFELWTVWPAFSPVPYHAAHVALAVNATPRVVVRGRVERYRFEPAEAATPLVDVEEAGWRWELGGTASPARGWTVDGAWRQEFGPGAAAAGASATVTYAPSSRLAVTLLGSAVNRPLEVRFNEAVVRTWGVDGELQASERLRVGATVSSVTQDHRRPDAAAVDWGRVRAAVRVVLLFGSGEDLRGLPPAIRLLPGGRAAR
jgi:hypothetical protein